MILKLEKKNSDIKQKHMQINATAAQILAKVRTATKWVIDSWEELVIFRTFKLWTTTPPPKNKIIIENVKSAVWVVRVFDSPGCFGGYFS